MSDYRLELTIESLETLCEESDTKIELNPDQIKEIAETLLENFDMMGEMEMNRHISRGPAKPKFVPADKVKLYRRTWTTGGTFMASGEESAGFLGDDVYAKETLYIKNRT